MIILSVAMGYFMEDYFIGMLFFVFLMIVNFILNMIKEGKL